MKRAYSLFAAAALAGVCAGEMSPGRFSHDMPESTNEKPTNPAYAEMAADFRDPFGKVRTGAYWYWMAGNVTSEGVKKDLQAMKRAGIDRAYIGDIGGGGNKLEPERRTLGEARTGDASPSGEQCGGGGPEVGREAACAEV